MSTVLKVLLALILGIVAFWLILVSCTAFYIFI